MQNKCSKFHHFTMHNLNAKVKVGVIVVFKISFAVINMKFSYSVLAFLLIGLHLLLTG